MESGEAAYMYRDGPKDFWKGCDREQAERFVEEGFQVCEFDERRFSMPNPPRRAMSA